MARDSQTKISKKDISKQSKKKEELRKKKFENSDSDSDDNDSESENDTLDIHEFRKCISRIFPSKHINNKIKAGEKLKKLSKKIDEDDEEMIDEDRVIVKTWFSLIHQFEFCDYCSRLLQEV